MHKNVGKGCDGRPERVPIGRTGKPFGGDLWACFASSDVETFRSPDEIGRPWKPFKRLSRGVPEKKVATVSRPGDFWETGKTFRLLFWAFPTWPNVETFRGGSENGRPGKPFRNVVPCDRGPPHASRGLCSLHHANEDSQATLAPGRTRCIHALRCKGGRRRGTRGAGPRRGARRGGRGHAGGREEATGRQGAGFKGFCDCENSCSQYFLDISFRLRNGNIV